MLRKAILHMTVVTCAMYIVDLLVTKGFEKISKYREGADTRMATEIAKKGDVALRAKKWDEAIKLFTEAIKLSDCGSNTATYYVKRAEAHLESSSFNLAQIDCEIAIYFDKKIVKGYLIRGRALEELGRQKEADEDFRCARHLEIGQRKGNPFTSVQPDKRFIV